MSARIDGERMDHSRCLYPKFIGQCMIFKIPILLRPNS